MQTVVEHRPAGLCRYNPKPEFIQLIQRLAALPLPCEEHTASRETRGKERDAALDVGPDLRLAVVI